MQRLVKRSHVLKNKQQQFFSTKSALFAAEKKEKTFDKILIANRGEIACRVMKTCKKLGIKTVAVYSEADVNSKHVQLADEAICIGKPPVKQSYLMEDIILDAMLKTGAQAVHPGYGFLSENTRFAGKVEAAGLTFIGPPASAIKVMGDKLESKALAKRSGVNTIPGFEGQVESPEHAVQIAKKIGYPLMIKAAHGGGGKGMRIVWNDQELVEGFKLSRSEAENFFGDNTMLLERFIENPRHVEIQVLCDKHGNNLYLPERECSIQRRNQKVIEEAPSTVLDEKIRQAMGKQAVALCAAVGYVSAGTVEMLVDQNKNFYFLEMNTRLQVEHPITEYITGIDLVEQMIHVAAGYPLAIKQEDIKINGWATECRVYAEDPSKNFAPSIGTLETYKEPATDSGFVRVDSGILQGSEISVYYDPMISKTVTWGKDRPESIKRMIDALDSYVVSGVKHNIPLLRACLENKAYLDGKLTTYFLKEQMPDFHGIELTETQKSYLVACAAIMNFVYARRDASTTGRLNSATIPSEASYAITLGKEQTVPVSIGIENDVFIVDIHDKKDIDIVVKTNWTVGEVIFKAQLNGVQNVTMQLKKKEGSKLSIVYYGTEFTVEVQSELAKNLTKFMPIIQPPDLSKLLVAPMPGSMVRLAVKEGDIVSEHQELAVIEAMKMQNSLRAAADGKVKKIHFKAGDIVANGQKLIEFE